MGGMLMIAGAPHVGSMPPALSHACNALPVTLNSENSTSPAHGYQRPRMWPLRNPHVAHVHRRIVPSTHRGPPHDRSGLMPLDTNTSLNASKLSTNAMTAIITPTVTPGSMLTLSRPSASLVFLSFIPVPLRPALMAGLLC